jgi:hypothetical protein
MWHASSGKTTFSGPYGLMLAEGIGQMLEEMNDLHEMDEEYEIGLRAFDALTREQKIWSLRQVAFGLLDEKTSIIALTAYLEATIAAIFNHIDTSIQFELDIETDRESDPVDDYDYFFWRKLVLAAFESVGGNSPEICESDDELLTAECRDIQEWQFAFEVIEGHVLWDADYEDDDMVDMTPEHGAAARNMFGIADGYYVSVPDDPKPNVAKKLVKETAKLCNLVIKHERKSIKARNK